jgi:hypothetical protein
MNVREFMDIVLCWQSVPARELGLFHAGEL